jgi:hypothetical protein
MEHGEDFSIIIHGEEYGKKYNDLTAKLAEIEKKHFDYFKSIPSKHDTDPHDLFSNYYMIKATPPLISLAIIDLDLKDEIRHELYLALKTFFPQTQ